MVKRRYLASAVVGAVLTSAGMAGPVWAVPDDPVNFPDTAFRTCVNTALSQPADAVITEQQAASITAVYCGSRLVADLTGADSLTAATALNFHFGTIADLSPLAGLTNLRLLGLGANQITDVLPLAGLTNLEWIDLSLNQVRDLSPLAGLTKLTGLPANGQSPAVMVPCGVPYSNPVGMNGQPVPLTGAGYNPVSNTIDTTTEGTYQYTWGVPTLDGRGSNFFWGTLSVTVTCAPIPSVPVITATAPAAAATGTPYSFTVTATGTPAPAFTVTAGGLPDGLTLDTATGVISGTPTATGVFSFTITATNTAGSTTAEYTIPVESAPVVTSTAPGAGMVGTAYTHTITATGTPAPTFTVTAGVLPDGMALDKATGQITGTPAAAGVFAFTIAATNTAGTATADYTLTVDTAPVPGGNTPAGENPGTSSGTPDPAANLAATGVDTLPVALSALIALLTGSILLLLRLRTRTA